MSGFWFILPNNILNQSIMTFKVNSFNFDMDHLSKRSSLYFPEALDKCFYMLNKFLNEYGT